MATPRPTLRPLNCWKSILRRTQIHKATRSQLSTYRHPLPASSEAPVLNQLLPGPHVNKKIKTYQPPRSPVDRFKEPIKDLHNEQISVLDPTGARTRLFSKANPEAARVGDILLVRLKTGDPFSGVCINVRRRGVDTGILLRNQLTRVGVEMWYKIYSPLVEGIEVVQRSLKRARRARLTYMRKPKHDMGSVQNIVLQYQRSKGALRGGKDGKEEKNKGGKRKTKGRK